MYHALLQLDGHRQQHQLDRIRPPELAKGEVALHHQAEDRTTLIAFASRLHDLRTLQLCHDHQAWKSNQLNHLPPLQDIQSSH